MKKSIFKLLSLILIIAVIGGLSYLILYLTGFTEVDKFNELKSELGDSIIFWLIVILLQIFQTIFIPISNQLITGALAVIYNDELWKVWLSAAIGISIGSFLLYLIGRFSGGRLLKWVLGDENKAKQLQHRMNNNKGFYVIGMFIPFIPDDVLSTLAGVAKYKIWFVLVITFTARFTCTAFTTWGIGLLTRYWWMWIVLIAGILFMAGLSYIIIKKGNKNEN